MRRNPFASWPALIVLLAPAVGLPAHAVTSCAAGNPNVTSVIESTPTSAFTINGNGTVTHTRTGLMWKQCAEGQSGSSCGTGTATPMTWANALKAANDANAGPFAGYADWRVPNQKELESIVEHCGYAPAINTTVFPATPGGSFWSSSSYVLDPSRAWYVNFGYGNTFGYSKSGALSVRLVRAGQSVGSFDALSPTASVFYHGNGSTGGSVPTDGAAYAAGATVTVLGNTGGLVKTGASFTGWSAAGGGMVYPGGATFPMVGDVTLYAQWSSLICTLDVDANESVDALTDGLLIIRAMFGLTGTAVTSGAVGTRANRPTWDEIQRYLNTNCGARFGR